RARRGRRHSQRSLLACILCAVISGAKGSTEIGEWIERMSPTMLRQLRCRRTAAGEYQRPSESTVRRLLQKIPVESLEQELGGWLHTQAARAAQGPQAKKNTPRSPLTAKRCAAPMTGKNRPERCSPSSIKTAGSS
ncbi:transposase tnpA, partial [mine drainage metagenome]